MRLTAILRTLGATAVLLANAGAVWAGPVTVTGKTTYYDDGTHSRLECMKLAAEQARVEALAREFGTILTQDIEQTDRVSNGREHTDFLSRSTSEVRGEWLGDEEEPKYEITLGKDGNLIVECTVKGKADAITNEATEFEALVLRNQPDRQTADTRFRHGDSMYLYFNGASDGFVSAFLEDENGSVYQILPYTSDTRSRVPVRRDRSYVFFSPEKSGDGSTVTDELRLTAPERLEYNRVYVVYSPREYSRPVMESTGSFPTMRSADFTKWLAKVRRGDSKMGVKAMNISIEP